MNSYAIGNKYSGVVLIKDEEKIGFKERSTMRIWKHEILMLKKLLLPYTNPKIDRETEGEFNPQGIFERSNFGVIFVFF